MVVLHIKLRGRVAVVLEGLAGNLNADPETLDESQIPHDLRNIGVSVIRDTGTPKIVDGHLSKGTAGILNLDPIMELR